MSPCLILYPRAYFEAGYRCVPKQLDVTGCRILEFWGGCGVIRACRSYVKLRNSVKRSPTAGAWLNLCISIPGKRDMMMTPMDFYASITPDCNKFGVSGWSHIGQGAPYCFVFQWKLIQHMVGWFRIIYLEFRRIEHLKICTLHYFSFCSIFSFVVSRIGLFILGHGGSSCDCPRVRSGSG